MRYYNITVLNQDGSPYLLPGTTTPAVWTSHPNGNNNPAAAQIEMDVPVTVLAAPNAAASVRIHGVPLSLIGQSADFNDKYIRVYGGMQKGLPLANPAQSGLLVAGNIQQAFGNWILTDQWLEFVIVPTKADQRANLNLSFQAAAGEPLGAAAARMLRTALAGATVVDNTSAKLVLPHVVTNVSRNLYEFSQWIKQVTAPIIPGSYSGIDILISEKTITLFDGTSPKTPLAIKFQDLIGQPTWIGPGEVQVTTVMRADLQPNDYIKLPDTLVTVAPSNPLVGPFNSGAGLKDRSVFQGSYLIAAMRHVGSFRTPDSHSWVTTMNCVPVT